MSAAVGPEPNRFAAVAHAWDLVSAGRRAAAASWPGMMSEMADARGRVVAAGGWTAGPSTLMGVLELTRAEVQNCRVLRWLLDPLARHGLGARLTGSLCAHIEAAIAEPALARATVEISRGLSRADVVLEGLEGGRVVVIEAKIDAPEGDRQAHRLETDWPEAERLVFLTVPGGRIPTTATELERWRSLSWAWLAGQVTELLETTAAPTDSRAIDARRAAADWASGIRRNLQ